MKEFKIDTFKSLHDLLANYKDDKKWIFRGQADVDWSVKPKIGRPPYTGVDDRDIFEAWKRAAVEYVTVRPNNDWEWLAIAQHHGLATRLLDWTYNPLNAAFFAANENIETDAAIYACKFKFRVNQENVDPFKYDAGIAVFRPSRVVPRITRQSGVFTIHSKPDTDLSKSAIEATEIHRIVIKKSYRKKLLSDLSYYGVNSATLFPDLDGLSSFVNWAVESKEYFWK